MSDKAIVIAGGLGVLALMSVPVAYTVAAYQNEETHVCTVEDKESVAKDNGHEYRVYTDCGNFVVSDAMFRGNFHASDTYRELEPGKAYELTTIGFRIPFFSAFKNIVEAEEVTR